MLEAMRGRHVGGIRATRRRSDAFRRFALFFGAWLVLSGGRLDGLAFGIAAAAAATWTSLASSPPGAHRFSLLRLLAIVPGFLRASLAGGLDVARRAFDPRLPIEPGWRIHPVRLPPGAARVVLGGEISLLPGTLVAGASRDRLVVHCLDTNSPIEPALGDHEERLRRVITDD